MTSIVATRTDNFSIIISDMRENKIDESGYSDGFPKLRYIPRTGFITGSGWAPFLEEVKDRVVGMKGFTNPYEVVKVFKKTADEGKQDGYDDWINNSFIVFSWVEEVSNKFEYKVALLSESYYERNGANSMMLDKGDIRIIYPVDIVGKEICEEIRRKASEKKTNKMSINKALYEMLSLFHQISLNSDMVSNECQIGIQYFSPSTQENHHEILFGQADKLLNLARKNKIIKKFVPAGFI